MPELVEVGGRERVQRREGLERPHLDDVEGRDESTRRARGTLAAERA
jgi:hypothetical protein